LASGEDALVEAANAPASGKDAPVEPANALASVGNAVVEWADVLASGKDAFVEPANALANVGNAVVEWADVLASRKDAFVGPADALAGEGNAFAELVDALQRRLGAHGRPDELRTADGRTCFPRARVLFPRRIGVLRAIEPALAGREIVLGARFEGISPKDGGDLLGRGLWRRRRDRGCGDGSMHRIEPRDDREHQPRRAPAPADIDHVGRLHGAARGHRLGGCHDWTPSEPNGRA
jgi:hypothetical protein